MRHPFSGFALNQSYFSNYHGISVFILLILLSIAKMTPFYHDAKNTPQFMYLSFSARKMHFFREKFLYFY